jgi:methionyl-tRNA formyltransferase
MKNLVVFSDHTASIAPILLNGLIREVEDRNDAQIVALVIVKHKETMHKMAKQSLLMSAARYAVIKAFNPEYKWNYQGDIEEIAKEHNIEVIKTGSINSDEFINKISKYGDMAAISFSCPYLMSDKLLDKFSYAVNYHNSILPSYRGVHSTAFSMYFREKETGYTFHKMSSEYDSGNIILQNRIPQYGYTREEVDILKSEMASNDIRVIVDAIINNENGVPQKPYGITYGYKEMKKFLSETADVKDAKRKIKLFGYIFRDDEMVTKIDDNGKTTRICYLPTWLYRKVKWIIG